MRPPQRKIAFVLAATDHGTMILHRLDYRMIDQNQGFGVGFQILERSAFDPQEIDLALSLLDLRRKYFGDGVVAIDCGANIGAHTVEWAKKMTGWGHVIAIEAQERLFYALGGNIAINNCFNARAMHAAISAQVGTLRIPEPNYLAPGSYGSLELKRRSSTEFIGQPIDYSEGHLSEVRSMTLDSLQLARIDLVKIDIEGMELEALEGAQASLSRSHPVMIVEMLKTDKNALRNVLEKQGYRLFEMGLNLLAIHEKDPTLGHIKQS
jgi:FkbM family methyltransferase